MLLDLFVTGLHRLVRILVKPAPQEGKPRREIAAMPPKLPLNNTKTRVETKTPDAIGSKLIGRENTEPEEGRTNEIIG